MAVTPSPQVARGASDWLADVVAAERRGELFTAFDLAERGLEEHPDDVRLRHRAVLALARAGSTGEALRRFEDYGLAGVDDQDVQALRARLAKDVALAAPTQERKRRARAAAALYRRIFERTGGYYPGVNAATLLLVAGERNTAHEQAERVLAALEQEQEDSYYAAATEAEANLVLGREEAAASALRRAAELHGDDYGALSTTRRQLRLVCAAAGIDAGLLAAIAGRPVVYYCGHRLDSHGRFPASSEEQVRRQIETEIAKRSPGFAYGSLASGADILCAEALLMAGAEVHVVLPFERDDFVRSSVADAGDGWVARFERCLAAASTVRYATEDAYLGDDVLFRYGSELAMGLALLHASFLDTQARQLAVWDGDAAGGEAGTAVDVATWTSAGHPATLISPNGTSPPAPAPTATTADAAEASRVVRAMLFADVRGFSKLADEQLPIFAEHVLGAVADVLQRHLPSILCRETWGDGVYVVLTDAAAATICALDLRDAVESLDLRALGLPDHLALRLGGHVGPVRAVRNPVTGTTAFMGSHVSRTARIEPVTPPGAVFVTEPFAAAVALAGAPMSCEYVGYIAAAKDFGRLRMYRLRR